MCECVNVTKDQARVKVIISESDDSESDGTPKTKEMTKRQKTDRYVQIHSNTFVWKQVDGVVNFSVRVDGWMDRWSGTKTERERERE